jgi:hypothetical protein
MLAASEARAEYLMVLYTLNAHSFLLLRDTVLYCMHAYCSGKIRYLEFLAAALGVMDETWLSEDRLKDAFQVCLCIYTHCIYTYYIRCSHALCCARCALQYASSVLQRCDGAVYHSVLQEAVVVSLLVVLCMHRCLQCCLLASALSNCVPTAAICMCYTVEYTAHG